MFARLSFASALFMLVPAGVASAAPSSGSAASQAASDDEAFPRFGAPPADPWERRAAAYEDWKRRRNALGAGLGISVVVTAGGVAAFPAAFFAPTLEGFIAGVGVGAGLVVVGSIATAVTGVAVHRHRTRKPTMAGLGRGRVAWGLDGSGLRVRF
jgi:hypothetical protein